MGPVKTDAVFESYGGPNVVVPGGTDTLFGAWGQDPMPPPCVVGKTPQGADPISIQFTVEFARLLTVHTKSIFLINTHKEAPHPTQH